MPVKEKHLLLGIEPPFCTILNSVFLVVPGTVSAGTLELSIQLEAEWIVSWN